LVQSAVSFWRSSLKARVTELSLLVQSLESERKRWMEERREEEERSVEEEARRELERSYQCLSQAVVTLEVGLVRRRWEELQESLQDRLHQLEADNMETHTLLQHTHLELAHTQQILARERETVLGLQVEVIEKREEEEKKEKRRIRREIEREEEERRRTEREGQKGSSGGGGGRSAMSSMVAVGSDFAAATERRREEVSEPWRVTDFLFSVRLRSSRK
ncbi:hypothetical protein CRUP_018356, partial [Coryphaenoides rupestris]